MATSASDPARRERRAGAWMNPCPRFRIRTSAVRQRHERGEAAPMQPPPVHCMPSPDYCTMSSGGRFRICARDTVNGCWVVFTIVLPSDSVKVKVVPAL